MDSAFIRCVLIENLVEIKINALAMAKGSNERVRGIARRFFECHAKNIADITGVLQKKGIRVPKGTGTGECEGLEGLRLASSRGFDRIYMQTIARRQREITSLAKAELREGKDPEIREIAVRLLNQVEDHLTAAFATMKFQACG